MLGIILFTTHNVWNNPVDDARFSKWWIFLNFWFFDHSFKNFAFTATKAGATDSPHQGGHFGGKFVSFYL